MEGLIPAEAYRYNPKGDKIIIGSGSSIIRFIFYNTDFTDYEKAKIQEFKSFLSSKKYTIPEEYPEEEVLRTILGCKLNFKKTYEAILSSITWKKQKMPEGISSLYSKSELLLNSGAIYIHGRDHRYRPLIILNISKLDLDRYSSDDYCSLLCFILQYCIENLMIPGKVENWIIITDLNNQSLSSLPIHELKSIIKVLQDNFRCRMVVNYVLNSPRSLKFFWTMLSGFIEAHTVNKIRIVRGGKTDEIKKHFAMHQVEEKYGGTAANILDQFWPPVLPNGPFEAEGEVSGAHLDSFIVEEEKKDLNQDVFYSQDSSILTGNYEGCSNEKSIKGTASFSSGLSHYVKDDQSKAAENLEVPETEENIEDSVSGGNKDALNQEVFYSIASSTYYTAYNERFSTTERPIKRSTNFTSPDLESGSTNINTASLLEGHKKKKCCEKCVIF